MIKNKRKQKGFVVKKRSRKKSRVAVKKKLKEATSQ